MKKITGQFPISTSYDFNKIAPASKICFLDIETTGLSSGNSFLYLIGLVRICDDSFETLQLFAESHEDEPLLLTELSDYLKDYTHIIHFNGNTFDIPYLKAKYEQHGIPSPFNDLSGIDLYKRIRSFKKLLKLPDLKQKTIEALLDTGRVDEYSGGELIKVYENYLLNPNEEDLSLLLLHNREDILGLTRISIFMELTDIIETPQAVRKVVLNTYEDYYGVAKKELLITLKLSSDFPSDLSCREGDFYMNIEGDLLHISVPVLEDELKYFYANYKDYYYLPEEDAAFHKSVASFVDPEHRVKCTKANCYTKRKSLFVPEFAPVVQPIFKKNYEDTIQYFELTDEIKKNRDAFSLYASNILSYIAYKTSSDKE